MDPDLLLALGKGGADAAAPDSLGGLFNGGGSASGLLGALKGVPAMQPPQAQKVSTPPPPKIEPIKGGNLMALVNALGAPGLELMKNYTLPSTLTQALGR